MASLTTFTRRTLRSAESFVRPQRWYSQQNVIHAINRNVEGMERSATLAINERSHQLQREGKDVIKFGLGQSPFPVATPVVEALRANADQKDYLPVQGYVPLREAVAAHQSARFGLNLSADNVLVGPGSKELLFLMQLAYDGDLLLPNPSWVSYGPQAQIIGRRLMWLDTLMKNRWLVDPDDLDKFCAPFPYRARVLILNYPSNPTGVSMSEDYLKRIADVCRKYRILVVSDEIYGDVTFDRNHKSLACYYPEGTIISGGLSKWCGAGGWRLGLYSFPDELMWLQEAMAVVASETYTSVSAPIQAAAVTAYLPNKDIDNYVRKSCKVLKAVAERSVSVLRQSGHIDVVSPDGGFYIFPSWDRVREPLNARGIRTSMDLSSAILEETGVAFLPGSNFGRDPEELTCRIAFVDFDGEAALAAVDALTADELVDKHAEKVVEGMKRISEWTSNVCQ